MERIQAELNAPEMLTLVCSGGIYRPGMPSPLHETQVYSEGDEVAPSPATHATLTVLKAGESVLQTLY